MQKLYRDSRAYFGRSSIFQQDRWIIAVEGEGSVIIRVRESLKRRWRENNPKGPCHLGMAPCVLESVA
jgi:hypothetical protein